MNIGFDNGELSGEVSTADNGVLTILNVDW